MAELLFKDLSFERENERIKVNFLRIFYFYLENEQLERIGPYAIGKNTITFEKVSENSARKKFDFLLFNAFKSLKNKISKKSTYYIHKSSGIPLMGTNYFGIIDRGSNIIEVKPMTSCNIGCIFCSVDEGPKSKRKVDFVVEKDYLIEEFRKLVEYKNSDKIDAHINAQGEPTLYADMVGLVKDIMSTPGVKTSSIDTNALLLTKQYIDELADAGLTRMNLSLHAMDPKIATQLAGHPYNLSKVLEIAKYIPTTKMDLIIVPVWLPGFNDDELPKLAKFAHEIGAGKNCPAIGIQNALHYRFGRNPAKEASMDEFYKKMRELEEKYDMPLIINKNSFEIVDLPELPKPFKKGRTIEAEIILPGRIGSEMLAVAEDRIISVPNCHYGIGSKVRLKIKRTKHNIFLGELLN